MYKIIHYRKRLDGYALGDAHFQDGEPQTNKNRPKWENLHPADHKDGLQEVEGQLVVGIPGGANKWVKQALRLPQRRRSSQIAFQRCICNFCKSLCVSLTYC